MKNQSKNQNFANPIDSQDLFTKFIEDKKVEDPRIRRNTAHIDLINKKLDNVKFVKVTSFPAVVEQLTAKKVLMKLFRWA